MYCWCKVVQLLHYLLLCLTDSQYIYIYIYISCQGPNKSTQPPPFSSSSTCHNISLCESRSVMEYLRWFVHCSQFQSDSKTITATNKTCYISCPPLRFCLAFFLFPFSHYQKLKGWQRKLPRLKLLSPPSHGLYSSCCVTFLHSSISKLIYNPVLGILSLVIL